MLVAAGLVVLAGGSASATTRMVTEFPISTAGSHPGDMTVGPDGNTWFVEQKSGKIGEVTHNGTITGFAVPTKLSSPTAIASGPDGALWFTENSTNKIGRYLPSSGFKEYTIPTAKFIATWNHGGP